MTGTTNGTDLPARLRALAESLVGDEWEHPIDAVETCRKAADEVERLREELDETRMAVGTYIDASIALTRERDEARWAVRYLLENITQLQTRADLWGLRKKLTWLTETD